MSRKRSFGKETPHCYHLVTLKSARADAAFCGRPKMLRQRAVIYFDGGRAFYVLDLFSMRAMF
jgi:hypothetical protein